MDGLFNRESVNKLETAPPTPTLAVLKLGVVDVIPPLQMSFIDCHSLWRYPFKQQRSEVKHVAQACLATKTHNHYPEQA